MAYSASASGMVGTRGLTTPAAPSDPSKLDHLIRGNMEDFYFSQAGGAIKAGFAWSSFFTMAASMHVLAALATNSNVDGSKFKQFIRDHLPGYDPDAMWHCLRCGLFHSGGPGKGGSHKKNVQDVVVTSNDKASHDPDGSRNVHAGCVTIEAETLLDDLRAALHDVLAKKQANAHNYFLTLHPSTLT